MKLRICFVVTFISLLSPISYLCCIIRSGVIVMRTRGISPQLHARTYRRKSKKKTAQPVALWIEPASHWAWRLSKHEHLIIRVFFFHLLVCYLNIFSDYCKTALRIIINVCFFYMGANSSFAWCWLQATLRCWLLGFILCFVVVFHWNSVVVLHQNVIILLRNTWCQWK